MNAAMDRHSLKDAQAVVRAMAGPVVSFEQYCDH